MESNINSLFTKHNFISSTIGIVDSKLLKIKLEIEGKIIHFNFNNQFKDRQIEPTVRLCDQILLSRNGYREMCK